MKTGTVSNDHNSRDWYEILELIFKSAMLFLAVLAAVRAASAYQQEVNAKILDDQIKVSDEVFLEVATVMTATNKIDFDHALIKFGTFKHGHVLEAFGDNDSQAVYYSLVEFYNAGFDISDDKDFWSDFGQTGFEVSEALDTPCENVATTLHKFFQHQADHPWWHVW